jgi:Zn-dependent protease
MIMHEFASRIESRFRFTVKELSSLLITALVSAFGVTIAKGWNVFDLVGGSGVAPYVLNLLLVAALILVCFLIHFSAQKVVALKLGYSSEYKMWLNGLLLGPIICLFSYGYLPLFFSGTLFYDVVPKLRAGVFRGGVKHKELGAMAFAGPFSNIVLVGILAPAYLATKAPFLKTFIILNLLVAVFSLLPIPTFERVRQFSGGTTGLYLLIASRWVFVLVFAIVLAYSLLIILFSLFSYILAIIIGIVVAVIYYSRFESD